MPQIPELEAITTLTKIGVPLKDIQQYMENRSPEGLINILNDMSTQITDKIIELIKEKQLIDAKRNTTAEGLLNPFGEVFVKMLPEEYYMVEPYTEGLDAKSWYVAEALHSLNLKNSGLISAYTVGSIWQTYYNEDISEITPEYFQIRIIEKESNKINFTKPAGKYLVLYAEGGYNASVNAHTKLIKYADEKGYKLDKYLFKDIIYDELTVFDDKDSLLRLSVRLLT